MRSDDEKGKNWVEWIEKSLGRFLLFIDAGVMETVVT